MHLSFSGWADALYWYLGTPCVHYLTNMWNICSTGRSRDKIIRFPLQLIFSRRLHFQASDPCWQDKPSGDTTTNHHLRQPWLTGGIDGVLAGTPSSLRTRESACLRYGGRLQRRKRERGRVSPTIERMDAYRSVLFWKASPHFYFLFIFYTFFFFYKILHPENRG